MASNYPDDMDIFQEPSQPTTTPLGSGGDKPDPHWNWMNKMVSAIKRTQEKATKKTHNHDGTETEKLTQSNTHQSPDTDLSDQSLHHTIGYADGKAVPGDHTHHPSETGHNSPGNILKVFTPDGTYNASAFTPSHSSIVVTTN